MAAGFMPYRSVSSVLASGARRFVVFCFPAMVVRCCGWSGRLAPTSSSISSALSGSWGVAVVCVVPSSSKRHGGDGGIHGTTLLGLLLGCSGAVMPQDFGEHSRRPEIWRPTLMTIWWSPTLATMAGASSTSKWRPFVELAAAFIFLSVPSGLVPGTGEDGRGLSSQFSGGGRGPDCFFKFYFRVFSVRNRGWFLIVLLFRNPVVNCTYSAVFNEGI